MAPVDPRLPGGGGYVVSGLYDVVPDKAGQVDNLVADSSRYGAWSQYFNGVDVTVNVRVGSALHAHRRHEHRPDRRRQLRRPRAPAGARDDDDRDERVRRRAERLGGHARSPYCHVAYGILTQVRGLASYVIPKADVQVAATFQSKPGAMLAANYAVPNAAVVPSLGRNLSGNAPNVTVNLVAPGTMYGDRINQLDLRVGKTLKYRPLADAARRSTSTTRSTRAPC